MVVCITRPVHRLLARFWRKFDIHPDLIDSIAGIYILCFTQLAAISFKLLHFSKWGSLTSDEIGLAFYYDGSLDYFGWPHALAGSFAIIVLIAFVIIPTVYLLLYPLKLFQKFLDVCRIRREFTDSLIDSLTGPFKNGSQNTKDYRFFAGIYLLLRIIIICLHYIPHDVQNSELTTFDLAYSGILVMFCSAIIIFRPFVKDIHSFSNFLTVLNIIIVIFSVSQYENIHNEWYVSIIYILLCLPSIIVSGYCIYKIIRVCCKCKCKRQSSAPVVDDGDEQSPLLQQPNINVGVNDSFDADRIVNPDDYDERHFSNRWLQPHPLSRHSTSNTRNSNVLSQPTADGTEFSNH